MLNNTHISKQVSGSKGILIDGCIVLVVNVVLLLRKQGWE